MTGFDGTGPEGAGPMTGGARGPCATGLPADAASPVPQGRFARRVFGLGRRLFGGRLAGRGRGWFGRGRGRGRW